MHIPLLDLTRELGPHSEAIMTQWRQLLARPQFLNGDQVRLFEQEMAGFLGVAHVVGVASGTEALILGLAACGIGEGDEVILPANAFVAALEAVWWLKATPVLVDIQPWDLGPDPDQVRQHITRKTKAVLVVHLYGLPVDLTPLVDICRTSSLHLIEDCSHAHGASYHGKRVGSFGSVGCFSAGVVKNLAACGEAGFVATSDDTVARHLRLLRAHGQEEKNVHAVYGTNGRLDEVQAAVLRTKLPALDERNRRRQLIAQTYNNAFRDLGVTLPWDDDERTAVYHQYVIRTRQRTALRAHLREQCIETGIHYPTPLHLQPAWQTTYRQSLSFPHAERAAQQIVSLPVFPDLSFDEIAIVIQGVQSFYTPSERPSSQPQLSVVVPFCNEEGNVNVVYHELRSVLEHWGQTYEYLFVNDGSSDRTGTLLDAIARTDSNVRVIHLPDNRGEAAALSAGFQEARGRVVVTSDGDGQNNPQDIPRLLAKLDEGYQVVSGWRRDRQEGYWLRILPSRLANYLIARVTGISVHDCGCGLKVYRREVLTGLALPTGMHRFLPVILQVAAEAVAEVPVTDRARYSGQSHYGLRRLFAVLRDLLPVHCIRHGIQQTMPGVIIAALIALAGLLYFIRAEFLANSLETLTGAVIAAGAVVYLSLGYLRLQEFVEAQSQQQEQTNS